MRQRTVRRSVVVTGGSVARGRFGGGGRSRLWAFGYPELAALWGVSETAARKLVERGLDPADLTAVCREWVRRQTVYGVEKSGVVCPECYGGGGTHASHCSRGTTGAVMPPGLQDLTTERRK